MSAIGPELPPHLVAKRKRKQEEETETENSKASGANGSASPSDGEKRRRVMGPVMPPAPLDERPEGPPTGQEESDSEDDDGLGPALPPNGASETTAEVDPSNGADDALQHEPAASPEKPRRDEWMTMPPKQDDLAARMDPSKQRPSKFNTSKGAKGPNTGGDDNSAWHETIEQKQKRLADEMMGISKSASNGPRKPSTGPKEAAKDQAAAQKIQKHTEKTRGPTLLEQHQGRSDREVDDDPSTRAFDREKDMGSGMRVGHSQRKEMLNKASNFSSKFSGGSYL